MELWEVNQRNKSTINGMQMDYWRRCRRLTRQDIVLLSNEDVRNKMEIGINLKDTIQAKILNWYRHLQREMARNGGSGCHSAAA